MDIKTLADIPPWDWPEEAGKTIIKILSGDIADEADRLLACELAGDICVMNDELADQLLSIICDSEKPDIFRGKAAISLGPALEYYDIDEFDDDNEALISEVTYQRILKTFQTYFMNTDTPKETRRKILEASVRAQQDWHQDAISTAFNSGEKEWILTAVFSMRFVNGFDEQIIEALENPDPDIFYQAVCAAGNWAVDVAFPYIVDLLESKTTEKYLLLAAIEAIASIHPAEAESYLLNLTDSDDQDIVDAAHEAINMNEDWDNDEYYDEDE